MPPRAVTAHYVRFRVSGNRFSGGTDLEVPDATRFEPFDLCGAFPDEWSRRAPVHR